MRGWQTVRAGRPGEALELKSDLPAPKPRDDTVLVEVLAAGVGLPDALMCRGSYVLTPQLPFTQGQEVVGRVIGWGDAVKGRSLGDRVMAVTSFFTGDGSFAEQCLAFHDGGRLVVEPLHLRAQVRGFARGVGDRGNMIEAERLGRP